MIPHLLPMQEAVIASAGPGVIYPGTDPAVPVAASTLRRILSLRGAQSRLRLLRAAEMSLRGLMGPDAAALLERTLEQIIADRDALEPAEDVLPVQNEGALVYPQPPGLVQMTDGWLLVGCGLPAERLAAAAEGGLARRGHRRWVRGDVDGLPRLGPSAWAHAPKLDLRSLGEHARGILVARGRPAGDLRGLRVLERRPGYHLRAPTFRDRGPHVGRFPLLWGGEKWCLVDLGADGAPGKTLEFSHPELSALMPAAPPFEVAWTLHLAFATVEGVQYQAVATPDTQRPDRVDLRLEFPAPPWLARQLDLLGRRVALEWPVSWSITSTNLRAAHMRVEAAGFKLLSTPVTGVGT